jgi:4-amino-4-deoxychorismate lyase
MDRGLHYGDGLFETIACVDRRLQFWQQHIERMAAGAKKLKIAFPGSKLFLADIRNILDSQSDRQDCVIKLMLTRGTGERGYRSPEKPLTCRIVICSDWPNTIAQIAEQGARLRICDTRLATNPQLAGIKHLNRLENVLARNEWQIEFDEGLMTDTEGNIIEATMSNVLAVRNGVLFTPSLDRCGINGIIRQQLIGIAENLGIAVQEKIITQDELVDMDEIMLCNSVIGVWPVTMFAGRQYAIGKTTRLLATQMAERAKQHAQTVD